MTARRDILPERHCAACSSMVYRWRGRAYATRGAAERARCTEPKGTCVGPYCVDPPRAY